MVRVLDSKSMCPRFKTTAWLKVNSAGKLSPRSGSIALRQLKPIHKKGYKVQRIMRVIPSCTRIVINNAIKKGIPFGVLRRVNINWDKNMIRISH